MPTCTFCGRSVLPLFSAHGRCQRANQAARARLLELADRALASSDELAAVRAEVEALERDAYLTREQRGEVLHSRFEDRVRAALEDNLLTVEEESHLIDFTEAFSLGCEELDVDGWYTRFVQSAALRDLVHGRLPPAVLPMKLEPDEALIWLFPTAQLTEGAVLRQEHGPPVARSIPVSNGLYYRVSEPEPRSRERTVQRPVDAGSLGVTNRYAHFTGLRMRFRVRLEDFRDLQPTPKGVTFKRAEAGDRLEGFETGDGWFLMNLLSNARNARQAG